MSAQKLGIVAAMPEEFSLMVASFGAVRIGSVGPRDFYGARRGSVELVLVCSRIGKVAAASTATTLIQSFGADALLLTGVAGGVAPDLHIGDVVVADSLVQHDIDLRGVLGCNRFDIPLLGRSSISTCERLTSIASQAAEALVSDPAYSAAIQGFVQRSPASRSGIVASGDVFVQSERERDELRRAIPRLLAVEMEGAAVAQVCVEQGVPFAVARIISDSANSAAGVDFQAFLSKAAAVGSQRFVDEFVSRL